MYVHSCQLQLQIAALVTQQALIISYLNLWCCCAVYGTTTQRCSAAAAHGFILDAQQ
jgi:hypothetical protein